MRIPVGMGLVKNYIENTVKANFQENPQMKPLILAYFITFRCNLNCTYCTYIQDRFDYRFKEVNTQDAKNILRICRSGVPAVAFSGGEPLIRKDIVEIVHYAKQLRYRPITLFTNGILLPEKDEVLNDIDFLQISLDTVRDEDLVQRCGNIDMTRRIKGIIKKYAAVQDKKKFRLNINCVIGSDNIKDVPDLLCFAEEQNIRLTVCPTLDDFGQPVGELMYGDTPDRYRKLLDDLLMLKNHSKVLMDIRPFLQHIKTFEKYQCFPEASARIYPDGSYIHPCPNLHHYKQNILEAGSWKNLKQDLNSDQTVCDHPCYLPCYLETSLILKHPLSFLREVI